jgi:hypothetical protein
MSYDFSLYEKRFLRRAIAEGLGDWTGADDIPYEKLWLIRRCLTEKHYSTEDQEEYEHPNSIWGLQVHLFQCEVAFSVPYWDEIAAAVVVARADALDLATAADLGFYDPQTGEAIL